MQQTIQEIEIILKEHPVVLFMKGSVQQPMCGFSAQAVTILNAHGVEIYDIDILSRPDIRSALPAYSNWPTFPQLFVRGELVGGCDIVTQLQEDGMLADILHGTENKGRGGNQEKVTRE